MITYNYTGTLLTSISDKAGRQLLIGYTGSHITSVTDPNVTPHRTVTYEYNDGNGNLTDVVDVNGGTTHYIYDPSHRMTVMKDPYCMVGGPWCLGTRNQYDSSNRVTAQTDQMGRTTTFAYSGDPSSATGATTMIIDPKGNVTLDTYEYGVRVSETKGYGTSSAATTTYRYDSATVQPISVTDPNGHTTTMSYDSQGNLLTEQDALANPPATYTYNSLNEALTATDPQGVETTNTYDGVGNLTKVSTPCSDCSPSGTQVTTYTICEAASCTVGSNTYRQGDVEAMTDPDAKTWRYGYDAYGDRTSATDPLGDTNSSNYNADGWLLSTVAPKGNVTACGCASQYTTTYSYIVPATTTTDEFGDVQTITDPLGHVTTYGYDANRNKTLVKDANGNVTTYGYDFDNEETHIVRPGAPSTTLTTDYNPDGTILDQKDGKGNAIQNYTYDPLAHVRTITDALGHVTTYFYDAVGNELAKQDPGGNCIFTPLSGCTIMAYNADNELTSITYTDHLTPNVTNITYDADGQRTGMTDGTGTSSWTWDSLHRMTSYTNGAGAKSRYGYDIKGQETSILYPDGLLVTRGFDDAGRMSSVTVWISLGYTMTFAYGFNSNLTKTTLPSGTGIVDTDTYDNADNLTKISDKKGAATIFAATYKRDADNQVTSDSSATAKVGKYAYTPLNQLCYAGSANTKPCSSPPTSAYVYTLDAADNLMTTENAQHTGPAAQQFNSADELCWTVSGVSANACGTAPSGATTYTYDARGNRTGVQPPGFVGGCAGYDQADRLTSITVGGGSSCASPTTLGAYAYDGDGLRTSKTAGSTTTQFTWDESSGLPLLLQEQAVGSASPTAYIYGPNGLPIEQITSSGTPYWFHHDQLGSTACPE